MVLSPEFMKKLRQELSPLRKYGKTVVLYGSLLSDDFIPGRSDIDVAVVTMKRENNLNVMQNILGVVNPQKYDVRVFELLPLYIKAQVIKNYVVVFGDASEVGEYFYFWRKLCRDFEKRLEKVTLRDLKLGREVQKINQKNYLSSNLSPISTSGSLASSTTALAFVFGI